MQESSADHQEIIALVDDDRNILTSLSIVLEAEGYVVRTYRDGEQALEALRAKEGEVNLVISDIKMPHLNGMDLLRALRQFSDVSVIFLTSKDDEIEELLGFKMGADDFIRKPFSQRLLIERVRAVLRRATARKKTQQPAEILGEHCLQRGPLTLDKEKHLCSWNGHNISLTVTEFLILQALAQRPGVVKSRDALMDIAYGDHIYVDYRTIDSHIKRLRKKFKVIDAEFDMIETLYGVGYRYREQAPSVASN